MSKYTPHEKKIWQSGFFKGLQTAKSKYGITFIEPQLVDAKFFIETYIDVTRLKYTKLLAYVYEHPKKFKGEKFDEEINANRTVLHFLDFCQSVGIDAFIEYLKENIDFEKHSYITKENKSDS